jgi:hypothetical protein
MFLRTGATLLSLRRRVTLVAVIPGIGVDDAQWLLYQIVEVW